MLAAAIKADLSDIQSLRGLFLQETNFQVRYNAAHERGWTDSYLLTIDGLEVGYGSVKGQEIQDRDTIFEFFVILPFRRRARELFKRLLDACAAQFIECQSNDCLLTSMLYEFGHGIRTEVVLFAESVSTELCLPGADVRPRRSEDAVFEHRAEPLGDYLVEWKGDLVATGGFLLHYNYPFADLYMEVREDFRRRGVGSFLIQELKKLCYLSGRVPAARTGFDNIGSRATMLKAGMRVCGFMLLGNS